MRDYIVVLGVFVADTTYRADRQPMIGETVLGNMFTLGPGGKGSNQSVAAARAGGQVYIVTRLGCDPFADMALAIWAEAGVIPEITRNGDSYTGSAGIFVDEATGDNAIVICPGAGGMISPEDLEARKSLIADAAVFVTQLEQPSEAAMRGLRIAREGGATTVLNPAPAANLPEGMLALCDYVTPNESEAERLTGIAVRSIDDATRAAEALREAGTGTAIITLGANGALFHDGDRPVHIPAFKAGAVAETTGAGDAFNGGLAASLAHGTEPLYATRFGCAAAAISVTRVGAAASMPLRNEVEALLKGVR